MNFGRLAVADAVGAVLAHSVKLADRRLKKGRLLDHTDIKALNAAGIKEVIAARHQYDELPEDEAAQALTVPVCGKHIEASGAFTGRVNLTAQVDGLLYYDAEQLHALNCIHESLTIGALPPFARVRRGQMLATLKVIPLAAPKAAVATWQQCSHPVLSIRPFQHLRVGLIQTMLPGDPSRKLDKAEQVLKARIHSLGCTLTFEQRCSHESNALSTLITAGLEQNAQLILIAGASAIVDRGDIVPSAIVAAGGQIEHFGMPVDPGNLLLLAYHNAIPVLGLPGCAKSPKYNGLDPILQRLVTGLRVTAIDIMRMGVGGFLKEIDERPQPRALRASNALATTPKIAAVVLAAGQSQRTGGINKLLAQIGERNMIQCTVDTVVAANFADVVVVTGFEARAIEYSLKHRPVRCIHNADFTAGLSSSLAAGLGALNSDIDAAVVCLGDMPQISSDTLKHLMAAFDPIEQRGIIVPLHAGKRGNPVLWGRDFFTQIMQLRGDLGAKHLLSEHEAWVYEYESSDVGVVTDFDSAESLASLTKSVMA